MDVNAKSPPAGMYVRMTTERKGGGQKRRAASIPTTLTKRVAANSSVNNICFSGPFDPRRYSYHYNPNLFDGAAYDPADDFLESVGESSWSIPQFDVRQQHQVVGNSGNMASTKNYGNNTHSVLASLQPRDDELEKYKTKNKTLLKRYGNKVTELRIAKQKVEDLQEKVDDLMRQNKTLMLARGWSIEEREELQHRVAFLGRETDKLKEEKVAAATVTNELKSRYDVLSSKLVNERLEKASLIRQVNSGLEKIGSLTRKNRDLGKSLQEKANHRNGHMEAKPIFPKISKEFTKYVGLPISYNNSAGQVEVEDDDNSSVSTVVIPTVRNGPENESIRNETRVMVIEIEDSDTDDDSDSDSVVFISRTDHVSSASVIQD